MIEEMCEKMFEEMFENMLDMMLVEIMLVELVHMDMCAYTVPTNYLCCLLTYQMHLMDQCSF